MIRWLVLVSCSVLSALGVVYVGERVSDRAPGTDYVEEREKMIRNIGYDLSDNVLPIHEIMPGGVAKGGIPAINTPKYVPAADAAANINEETDRVIGVVINGEARAYPIRILNRHEIVNTEVGDQKYAVTFCPLCDSAVVFDRKTDLGELQFGVSGLLYNSNVLMYNVESEELPTEFLWAQVKGRGTGGKARNYELESMPLELTTWAEWKKQHPDTKVLTSEKPYRRNPYAKYLREEKLKRLVNPLNPLLKPKTPILGIWGEKTHRAYQIEPFAENQNRLEEVIDGKKIVLEYLPESNSMRVVEAEEGLQWMYSFWFAWASMHTRTELYSSTENIPQEKL